MQSSGNEVFLRNPYNVNENLYVTISSPSSSKYKESDLQSPEATAQVILQQFLKEYMSTRLGVRREADIVDAALLSGDDQKQYSQIQVQDQFLTAFGQDIYQVTAMHTNHIAGPCLQESKPASVWKQCGWAPRHMHAQACHRLMSRQFVRSLKHVSLPNCSKA